MKASFVTMGLLAILSGAAAQSQIVDVITTTEEILDDDIPATYDDDGISIPEDTPSPAAGDAVTAEPSATGTLDLATPAPLMPGVTPSPAETSPPSVATDDETEGDADRALDDDIEEGVVDDDVAEDVDANETDGAAGAWGNKGAAAWGGAVAVGALGAVVLAML